PPVLLNRGGQITNLRMRGWRGNRIPASPRLRVSVSRYFLLLDDDLHAGSLFRISRRRDSAVVAYFLVEDVPATVNSLDNLLRLIAERMPDIFQALHQRVVRNRRVNPDSMNQFIFADESLIVFDQILQGFK